MKFMDVYIFAYCSDRELRWPFETITKTHKSRLLADEMKNNNIELYSMRALHNGDIDVEKK